MGVVNLSSQNQGNIMARATWLDTRARKVDVKGKQRRKPGFLSVSVVRQEGWLEQLACVWASYLHESYPDQPPKQEMGLPSESQGNDSCRAHSSSQVC